MELRPLSNPLARLSLAFSLALAASPAYAQDEDDFDFLDLEEEEDEAADEDEAVDEDLGFDVSPDEDADEDGDFDYDDLDFDEEEGSIDVDQEGVDNASIYRAKQDEVERLGPEEESIEWERYLREYPNSQFRSRIEARMDRLADEMYGGTIQTEEMQEEAGKAEIYFAQPFNLESIDPRKKIRAGLEFGLPSYLAPILDFEWAFMRNFSAHVGIRGRYGGSSLEPGVTYALLKSARTTTLLTLKADARVNLSPAYVGLRPVVGFGQRVNLGDSTFMDAQLQVGTELVTYGIFSPRLVGGANVSVAPGDTVRFWFETSTYMKDLGWDQGGSFRFNVISFGVKFLERHKTQQASRFEIGGGAMAPYSSNYWSFHSGAIGLDAQYYLD